MIGKILKKNFRIVFKFFQYFIINTLSFFTGKNFKIIPALNEIKISSFDYSNSSRRLVFKADTNKFGKVVFDTSLLNSKLCLLGSKFGTNKSSINLEGPRSSFTGLYTLILSNIRNKKINFAEIGVEKNSSIKMWRDFFPKAKIFAFDNDNKKLVLAKKKKVYQTYYNKMDVKNSKDIKANLGKIKGKIDVLLDDSTHEFEDQIRIIKNSYKFLKKDGIIIIEDIHRYKKSHKEENYFKELKTIKKHFFEIIFLESYNTNNFTANWHNEKILLLVKK